MTFRVGSADAAGAAGALGDAADALGDAGALGDAADAVEEPASYEFAGTPDAFQRLWTPHRMVYIAGEGKPASGEEQHCPFCEVPKRADPDGLIVARGRDVYAVLNLYPYNPGHLMVVPYRHFADYTDLTEPESSELVRFVQRAMAAADVGVTARPDRLMTVSPAMT